MELEPVFCDVAVKRWEQWTGKKAKLARGAPGGGKRKKGIKGATKREKRPQGHTVGRKALKNERTGTY